MSFSKSTTVKKLVSLSIVFVIFFGAFLAPFGLTEQEGFSLSIAHAQNAKPTCMSSLFDTPNIPGCLAIGANELLKIGGYAVWAGGLVLNQAAIISVVQTGEYVRAVDGINVAWKILRDLGNIIIIFSLLAIGIATILQVSNYGMKALLMRLVIVALLINFSLFFTKLVIDIGNIFSAQFYNQITRDVALFDPVSEEPIPCDAAADGCLSDAFMDTLKLTTLYNVSDIRDVGTQSQPLEDSSIIITGIFGFVFLLITAFVFFAGGILLLLRLVLLILLMILSPLAFAAWILPYTQGYAKRWWSTLVSQVLFAPLYFLMLLVSFKVLGGNGGGIQELLIRDTGASFSGALNGAESAVGVFSYFIVAIGFMIASLIIAKQLGAWGSQTVVGWGDSLRKATQGVLGRKFIAKPFRGIDDFLGRRGWGSSSTGQAIRRVTTGALAGAKFGSGQSLSDIESLDEKGLDRTTNQLKDDPKKLAAYINRLNDGQRAYVYGKLSARDRAAVEPHLGGGGRIRAATSPLQAALHPVKTSKTILAGESQEDVQGRLRKSLTIEEQEKVQKAASEAEQSARNKVLKDAIQAYAESKAITEINPKTGKQYTIEELMSSLPASEARKLKPEARKNGGVIRNLSTRHLNDLARNGDLKPDEVRAITDTINNTGTPYGNQKSHQDFIKKPGQSGFWET